MRNPWLTRLFFALVGVMAVAGLLSGTACTRWGQPGPISPTLAPISTIFVNAKTGSDTSGNGSSPRPYRTITKALDVAATSKAVSSTGVTIDLASGDYTAANGEIFPLVLPKDVVEILGSNYGSGPTAGSFIDGSGQDTLFERVVHAAAGTEFTTLEVLPTATVTIDNVYIGDATLKLPNSRAAYTSLDTFGAVTSTASFGAGIVSPLRNVSGVLVPGGSFACSSCSIRGNDFGIAALSVPGSATPQPSATPSSPSSPTPALGPTITLSHAAGDSTIAAKVVDILTDGSVNIDASGQRFELGEYAYEDALPAVVPVSTRGTVDFGGGAANSGGGNNFIGARVTEIAITRRFVTLSALDCTWNPGQQGANRSGAYTAQRTFASGASGRNVTILSNAVGSTVTVGPAPVPTPTPTVTPSTGPSPTTTPT
jgi:hypothetical protein